MDGDTAFSAVQYRVDRRLATGIARSSPQDEQRVWYRDFEAEMRSFAQRHLGVRPGYFVLSGMEHLSEAEARCFALATSRMLGEVMPQDFRGEMLRDVRFRNVRLEEVATARYSDTRQGGNLHTDGMHRPGRVPDFFSLYCVRPARRGGELVLVHIADLMELMRERPDVLTTLRLPVHFDTRDRSTPNVPRTVRRPIIDLADATERVHYLREYIESGHRIDDVEPLSAEQVAALDVLDSLLYRRDLQVRRRQRAGEMVFVDNRSIVHGRTSFVDARMGGDRRLLLRVWIAAEQKLTDRLHERTGDRDRRAGRT